MIDDLRETTDIIDRQHARSMKVLGALFLLLLIAFLLIEGVFRG